MNIITPKVVRNGIVNYANDIPSKTVPGKTYSVTKKEGDAYACNCDGYMYNGKCSHITDFKEAEIPVDPIARIIKLCVEDLKEDANETTPNTSVDATDPK